MLPPAPRERVPSPLEGVDGNGDVSSSVLSVAGLAAGFVPGSVAGRVDDPVVLAAAASVLALILLLHGITRGVKGRRVGGAARERPDRMALLLVVLLVLTGLSGAAYLLATDGLPGFAAPGGSGGIAPEGPHEVSACTTIDDPGRYVLTTDLESETDACLEVVADDVVLDGGGHVIVGDLVQGSTAIAVGSLGEGTGPVRNVTVRNVTVENWVFGVVYTDVDGGRLADVRTFHNIEAVTITDSTDVTVRDARVREGCVGLDVVRSRDVRVVRTDVRWLSIVAVSVVDSHGVLFSNVSVAHADVGISLYRSTDVTYDDVTYDGVAVTEADGWDSPAVRSDSLYCTLPCAVIDEWNSGCVDSYGRS